MFNKLMVNLAFNPSTLDQVAFYAKRLRQEESIRRTGFVLIALSMCVQIFAAMVPPEKSLAASNNDVIYGGVNTISELKNKYHAKSDVKALYNRFGIDSSDMNTTGGARNVSFNFQEQGAKGTKTVGRVNFASTKDTVLGPYAGTTFYARNAGEWQGSTPAYFFDKHKGTDGKFYYVWVLKDCGNIAYRSADAPESNPKPVSTPVTTTPSTVLPTPTTTTAPTTPTTPAPQPTQPTQQPAPAPTVTQQQPVTQQTSQPNIERSKTVQNLSLKLTPEQTVNTKARPGNILEYKLITRNTSVTPKHDYVVEDYVGDILDYADLDTSSVGLQGGRYDTATKKIIWEKQTIPAKGEVVKIFRVAMKATIPSTNQPNATAPDYDCKMQNGYGNETIVHVECTPLKTVEALPNTGPGTTIAIVFGVTVMSGYFLMRSRLLAKEVGIVKKSYQAGY